ncbi:MAG TPA: hypothetical protein VGI10_14260 [Polyangiaceae bacterium]
MKYSRACEAGAQVGFDIGPWTRGAATSPPFCDPALYFDTPRGVDFGLVCRVADAVEQGERNVFSLRRWQIHCLRENVSGATHAHTIRAMVGVVESGA